VRAKSEATDLVTEADLQAERMIKAEVAELSPDRACSSARNRGRRSGAARKLAGAISPIVVDPVDGTFNFAAGMPAFGVMASVVAKGETIAGIIYDPMGDDWVIAEKGSGRVASAADGSQERLSVARPVALERWSAGLDRISTAGQARRDPGQTWPRCAFSRTIAARPMSTGLCRRSCALPHVQQADALGSSWRDADMRRKPAHTPPASTALPYLPHHRRWRPADRASDKESWELLRREVFTV
jgi:hypothetical protein